MNEQEAFEVASRIKSAWPNSFMDEQMVFHWADFLRPYGLDEAVKAIFVLQEKEARLPPQAAFVDVMEGEAAHRAKCPKCGIGFRTEARVQEHIDNVHW